MTPVNKARRLLEMHKKAADIALSDMDPRKGTAALHEVKAYAFSDFHSICTALVAAEERLAELERAVERTAAIMRQVRRSTDASDAPINAPVLTRAHLPLSDTTGE